MLSDEPEGRLWQDIGLSQHGRSRLHENLLTSKVGTFLSHVYIRNTTP